MFKQEIVYITDLIWYSPLIDCLATQLINN